MKVKNFVVLAALVISVSAVASWASDNTDNTSAVPTTDGLVMPGPGGHGGPGGGHGGGGFPGHGGGFGPGHGGGGGFGPGHGGFGPGHGGQIFPVHGGGYPWPHWNRPYWNRPIYAWDWATLQSVTCTSVDSNGNYYPVTEDGYVGAYEQNIGSIEDASLDRCYSETNGDQGCSFVDCEPTY